ncbi:MAG TPA: phosphate/phosphite/phosphonate ABC transporter substrate-binding protein, partial [Ktedonobacteraceae bacterium]
KSFAIPEGPIAVRKGLSQSDIASLRAAFLDLNNNAAALNALASGGFINDTDSSFNPIRDLARKLNLDLTKLVQ